MDATSTTTAITAINGLPCAETASTTAPTPAAAGMRIIPSDPPIAGASALAGGAANSNGPVRSPAVAVNGRGMAGSPVPA